MPRHRRYGKIGPYPIHGTYGDRFLRDSKKEWQKMTGRSGITWLHHFPMSVSFSSKAIRYFVEDSRGQKYIIWFNGQLTKEKNVVSGRLKN